MATNPFKDDSWEWHAYEAAAYINTMYYMVSEDWPTMWADVFEAEESGVDWHLAQLGFSGLVMADRHGVPQANDNKTAVLFLAGKQKDYGPLNITKFGIEGIKVRSSDKVERILNLKGKDRDGTTEPLGDAYFDLWGYMVVLRMFKLGVFTKPLADEMPVSTETVNDDNIVRYGDQVWLEQDGTTHSGRDIIYIVRKL